MAKISAVSRNVQADAFGNQFNSGTLKCYTGSPPADPQTAPTGTLIVTINLNADAFPAAVDGFISMSAATEGTVVADGTIGWGRFENSGGTVTIMDVTIALTGADLDATKVAVLIGEKVNIGTFTYTVPE